jgi:hypothetical protein
MRPFFPIIYVRGYAMRPSEIAETVSTPYMGFNLGATRVRQDWQGTVLRHVFESPLIRLMKDYGYRDVYQDGSEITGPIPAKSVVIYRYYEAADAEFGSGRTLSIEEAAQGLKALIHQLRDQVCDQDPVLRTQFRVYLVAHSMGGLVCRAFLQNDAISSPEDRALVEKVFTYATPHNGIELAGMNVPAVLGLWDMNNFNRRRMAEYLGLPKGAKRVDTLGGKFPVERFFCLVGTNHRDYGLARIAAGEMSDGLVRIENATVQGAPRAFVYRSHSGPYGIVNSEEGYQNLVRFLFGDVCMTGVLEPSSLPLPPSIQRAFDQGQRIRASYYFEATVAPRGAFMFKLSERRVETNSAILRRFDELFGRGGAPLADARSPVLFSTFLDTAKITAGRTLVFSVDLAVSTTGYNVDGTLLTRQHVPGEHLFRNNVTVRATRTDDGWNLRYVLADDQWGESRGSDAERDGDGWLIPLRSEKGFEGRLRLTARLRDG